MLESQLKLDQQALPSLLFQIFEAKAMQAFQVECPKAIEAATLIAEEKSEWLGLKALEQLLRYPCYQTERNIKLAFELDEKLNSGRNRVMRAKLCMHINKLDVFEEDLSHLRDPVYSKLNLQALKFVLEHRPDPDLIDTICATNDASDTPTDSIFFWQIKVTHSAFTSRLDEARLMPKALEEIDKALKSMLVLVSYDESHVFLDNCYL